MASIAACTAGKAPSNDPDRSMTKDMSTSRRVAVAPADTVRVSNLAMRMKVVGSVAVEDTVMMWEPSEPISNFSPGGFRRELTPRKPGGKFALKMLLATAVAVAESAVMFRAAARAAASTAFARATRTRYPRPRSMASPVHSRIGTRKMPTYTRAMPFSLASSTLSMVIRLSPRAHPRVALRSTRPSRGCWGAGRPRAA